jgi:3',5'-cyclic AMP phosphodiesterase CpdA
MEGTAAQADFCFVHFTDTHIMAGGTLGHLDTSASLRRVIEVINALEPRPAFAVIGGDLVSPDMLDRNRTLTPAEYAPSYHCSWN